jgi:hypothetical protein
MLNKAIEESTGVISREVCIIFNFPICLLSVFSVCDRIIDLLFKSFLIGDEQDSALKIIPLPKNQ